jgi:hypothetical protein
VEQDAVVTIDAYTSQSGAPWGLGRVSHHATNVTTYTYDSSAGAGTCSYVIDTGIYTAHEVGTLPPHPISRIAFDWQANPH